MKEIMVIQKTSSLDDSEMFYFFKKNITCIYSFTFLQT